MVPRAARRPSLGAAGAAACAALALWVSFGALSFVDAENGAPYVGILPPLLWLALFLAAAGICIICFRPSARAVAPLWLSAVAILPWLPFPLPLSVLIWTGNVLLWLWAGIAVAMLAPAIVRAARSEPLARMPPRKAALAAGLLAAALYGLGTWSVAPAHPDGDEPHYLVITQSLLLDHDITIENNHTRGDYQAYLDRSIKPDFLKRGKDGQIYSIHGPGLPLLVAPGFALLGYSGVLTELVLASAAASALLWLVAWRVTRDAAASWFGWAAFALSVPFFFHASAIFPDGLGAVLTLPALLPLVDARAREPRSLAAVGAALAVLPWLNSRFVFLAFMAALVIAARLAEDRPRLASRLSAFAICPAISAVAFFLFFQVIYGTPNPSVVYGGVPTMSLSAGTLVRGVPGLLFDQQFGLIPNAPVYLCAFAGLAVMMWRGPRRLALELLLIAVPYLLIAASFTSWWGGTTAPARYFVPIAPLLAVPAAFWFATAKSVAARTVSLSALLVSVLMTATIASVDRGAFVFNFRDGMSRVAVWLSPAVDLTEALPSLFQNDPGIVLLQTAVWLMAIAMAVAAALFFGRRDRAAAVIAFGLAFEMTAMAAVSVVWRSNDAVVATPSAGGSAVLRRYDPDARQVAVAYRPFHRLELGDLPKQIVLGRALSTPRLASASLSHLPAGVYEVTGTTIGAAAGRVRMKTDRVSGPLVDWDAAAFGSAWTRQLTLPVGVASLQLEADPAARIALRDVSIRAVSVSAPENGLEHREARRGARYGPATVFLLDGEAWVEPVGIWIAGRSDAEFVISPEAPEAPEAPVDTVAQSPFQLFVRNGPVENVVTLDSGGWRDTLTLRPGEERLMQIPAHADRRTTPLHVAAASGFRPADVDPKSEDRRFLGVWIETR